MIRGLLAGCVVAMACLGGCKEKSTGALETFATANSCPEDQVTVKPRPDLDPETVMERASEARPSAEVAADPARLAKWTQDQDERRESRASSYGGYEMFEVSGCGHTTVYACHHPHSLKGGTREDQVSCDESRADVDAREREKEAAKDAAKAARRKAKEDAKAAKRAARDGTSEPPAAP